MDRPTTRTDADARNAHGPEDFVLSSRGPALDACRGPLRHGRPGSGSGPILITGEAGVGKTWFWRRLEAGSRPSERWAGVDLTPLDGPDEFRGLIAHEVGLAATAPSRVEIVDFLDDRRADGRSFTLVVEEAHNLNLDVWEEIRVLANRLGRPGGFAAIVLVGQTELARRFATRPFAAIEARLAGRVHLGPIDADEAVELLARARPDRTWSVEEVEALHRDSLGNPGRMLRLARILAPRTPDVPGPAVEREAPRILEIAAIPTPPAPLVGPSRPPIRVEENMIEVGWSPDEPGPAADETDGTGPSPGLAVEPAGSGEEAVNDHYAALQAWREWSENQGRIGRTVPDVIDEDEEEAEGDIEDEDEDGPEPVSDATLDRRTVRAEGEQKFAPFGPLFTRAARPLEPESPDGTRR